MPRNEGLGHTERDRLLWGRELARRKFFWRPGDIRLVRPAKGRGEAPGRGSGGPREAGGRPGPGRG